jgi:hypothetical protein
LIGSVFDPINPEKSNNDIISEISSKAKTFYDFIGLIKPLTGRYAFIYKDEYDFLIFNDPLALREIYFCAQPNKVICGSQPNIIVEFADPVIRPREDSEFLEYYYANSKNKKWNPYRKWIGDETYYNGIKHLLPNHYFNIANYEVNRYWPNEKINRLDLDDAVIKICSFLRGALKAIVNRHSIMLAVTAGTDSRTLLAASKDIFRDIYYFINDYNLNVNHPDIAVPKNMMNSIRIPFNIHNVEKNIDFNFSQVFMNNTFFSSDRILPVIYNVYYKKFNDKVNVLGIGEIGRTRFGKEPRKLNGYRMSYKLGYRGEKYAVTQGQKILDELLPVCRKFNLNIMTLFYWEQMLGNWGPTGNSESDIAIEEYNVYDSHLLYEMLLGIDDKYTGYYDSILFKEIIRYMWPELLNWPINPSKDIHSKIENILKKLKIFKVLKEIKYQINYLKYSWGNK